MSRDRKFYLVREDILPEAILKTAQAKELLAQGQVQDIAEAVQMAGLARSTFYKYRDGVFPFLDTKNMKIVNLSLTLRHHPGVLSQVLNRVASQRGNVLTINQNLPLQGAANVTLSVDVEDMEISVDELLSEITGIEGVVKTELIGRS
ncbi:MAG: ACT domain-containing protein [Candidatus Saccharibacteria bacterium]